METTVFDSRTSCESFDCITNSCIHTGLLMQSTPDNSNQNRFPLDFLHSLLFFTLDYSNLPLTRSNFVFLQISSIQFYSRKFESCFRRVKLRKERSELQSKTLNFSQNDSVFFFFKILYFLVRVQFKYNV